MPIDRPTLEAAIKASGGAPQPDDQVKSLLGKLRMLEVTGRYEALIKVLTMANNTSNFLAHLFEATFAHQFETAGMHLTYEVKQISKQSSSIDFRLEGQTGDTVFFELQLQQQDQATANNIAQQLAVGSSYATMKNGHGEAADIYRLQSTILRKVQKPDGTPVKFVQAGAGVVNIVVVCISDILLGTPDKFDCLLTTYGDPEVPEHCRRGVFGLFQNTKTEYPENFQARAAKYAHIKAILHGVMFLFRPNDSGVLNYHPRQIMVWNRNLVSSDQAASLTKQFSRALPANQ